MRKALLVGAALATLSVAAISGVANAADMPLKAPRAPLPPAFSWSGWYIGGNIGGTWADPSGSASSAAVTAGATTVPAGTLPFGSTSASSFMGGGQLGYNWQVGPTVFGVEGSIDAQNWHSTRTATAGGPGVFVAGDSFTARSHWQDSVRGRLGYAWDRTMIYATGGVSWTRVNVGTNFVAVANVANPALPFPASSASDSSTLTGATVGGGLDYAVTNNISLGVEGLYTWYGTHTYNGGTVAAIYSPATGFTNTTATQSIRVNEASVMGTLNFRLGSLFGMH